MAMAMELSAGETVLPEAMVIEVLLRLPLKYLCRWKCVSKTWYSVISEKIMKLHHVCNLGIVISSFGCSISNSMFQSRLGLQNNNAPRFIIKQLVGEHESAEIGFTQVINGLFCFYTRAGDLTLCNSNTFETMKLPLPSFYKHNIYNSQFYFGFDPPSGSYKLLGFGHLSDPSFYLEILTLERADDMTTRSWRDVSAYRTAIQGDDRRIVATDVFCKPSVCINGNLYWWVEHKNHCARKILAFDLGGLYFHIIDLPAQLVNAHFDERADLTTAKILKFEGNLAVGCLDYATGKLNVWEIGNCCRRCDGLNCWSKCSITLPEELVRCNRESCCTIGNLPTGEILFANPKANDDDCNFTAIYSYDDSTGKFERFIVGKFPPCMVTAVESSEIQMSCFELNNSSHFLEALLLKHPTAVVDVFFRRKLRCLTVEGYGRPAKNYLRDIVYFRINSI